MEKIYDPLTGQWYNPRVYEVVSEIANRYRTYQIHNVQHEELLSNKEYSMSTKTYASKTKRKTRKRRPKTKNKQQDRRISKLEKFIYPTIEYKSRDIVATDAPISSSGYANQPMMQIEQGTANNQRIGDSVALMQPRS